MVAHEHGFCVRRAAGSPRARVLFLLSTCTWTAYNDWGGINNYVGAKPPPGFHLGPRLSLHRPYARGLIWLPRGAPRIVDELVPSIGDTPRYQSYEWAYAKGFASSLPAPAGRPTSATLPSGRNGKESKSTISPNTTSTGIRPRSRGIVAWSSSGIVSTGQRACAMPWTLGWSQVGTLHASPAISAGKSDWRTRADPGVLQGAGTKSRPRCRHRRLEAHHHPVGRPGRSSARGSLTFGLQTVHGIYARVGTAVPRGSGGFTVYRPGHWAFRDADLYYGDSFGSTARIFGFEMDGLEYEFRDGLPFPKPSSAIPPGLEILAMNVASPVEADHGHPSTKLFIGDAAVQGISQVRYGTTSADRLEAARRGSGMIVSFKKGAGEVFHAGASEWVNGLRLREPFTEAITRTVVRRMAGID